jgi:hypothetical protein
MALARLGSSRLLLHGAFHCRDTTKAGPELGSVFGLARVVRRSKFNESLFTINEPTKSPLPNTAAIPTLAET